MATLCLPLGQDLRPALGVQSQDRGKQDRGKQDRVALPAGPGRSGLHRRAAHRPRGLLRVLGVLRGLGSRRPT